MNKELTELVFILDRSGSMGGLESDTKDRVVVIISDALRFEVAHAKVHILCIQMVCILLRLIKI